MKKRSSKLILYIILFFVLIMSYILFSFIILEKYKNNIKKEYLEIYETNFESNYAKKISNDLNNLYDEINKLDINNIEEEVKGISSDFEISYLEYSIDEFNSIDLNSELKEYIISRIKYNNENVPINIIKIRIPFSYIFNDFLMNKNYLNIDIIEKNDSINLNKLLLEDKNYIYYNNLDFINNNQDKNYLLELKLNKDYFDDQIKVQSKTFFIYLGVSLFLIIILIIILYNFLLQQKKHLINNRKLKKQNKYQININKKGIIKYYNKKFMDNIKDFYIYKKLTDFNIYCDKTCSLILEDYETFTIKIKNIKDEDIYIRFQVLNSFFKLILLGDDITKEIIEEKNLKQIAYYNNITTLPNLNSLHKLIDEALIKFKNNTLVLLDFVSYNNINKLFGREIGDTSLNIYSNKLKECLINNNCNLFHIYDETFAIFLINNTKEDLIINNIRKLLSDFNSPCEIKGNYLHLKTKIGIYISKDENDKYFDYIQKADMALKKAKNSRIDNYIVYTSSIGQSFSRDQLVEEDMKNAVIKDEFILYYQPQYDNNLKKIIGFETLLRWNNQKYINDSPYEYIKLAEKTNLITKIGPMIMEKAFMFARTLQNYNISLSINVSPIQMLQAGFLDDILRLKKKYNINPNYIAFEITETFLMESFNDTIEKINVLKKQGFKLHLDDFGSGYSSLIYIKELPIDALKIDREFTKLIETDAHTKAIISMIIKLAKDLDIEVITEGVENDKQNNFLIKNKSYIIQGYYISKPVNEDKVFDLVKKYNNIEMKKVDSND